METLLKIPVSEELPKISGKYPVFTRTSGPMKRVGVFNCVFTTKNEGQTGNWGCSNQIVTHWLKNKV